MRRLFPSGRKIFAAADGQLLSLPTVSKRREGDRELFCAFGKIQIDGPGVYAPISAIFLPSSGGLSLRLQRSGISLTMHMETAAGAPLYFSGRHCFVEPGAPVRAGQVLFYLPGEILSQKTDAVLCICALSDRCLRPAREKTRLHGGRTPLFVLCPLNNSAKNPR